MEIIKLLERPGSIGANKAKKIEEFNQKYGAGNWAYIWKFEDSIIDFEKACFVYEEAYLRDSYRRENLWKDLFSKAKDFYDNDITNLLSGTNYLMQESNLTHIQDIAVRRVGLERGFEYGGNRLIQIRGPKSEGALLDPGVVQFHRIDLIEKPNIAPSWAHPNSVESFYQNNKYLAIVKN